MEKSSWQEHIAAQRQSGVTIKEYCLGHGISDKSFSFRKSQLKKLEQPSPKERFAEVVSTHQLRPIRVELPGGIILSVVGKDALREVLSVVGFINR